MQRWRILVWTTLARSVYTLSQGTSVPKNHRESKKVNDQIDHGKLEDKPIARDELVREQIGEI